jgi:hypothetical protein
MHPRFPKKTVFVLGAGASYDYGYPSGKELYNEIIYRTRGDTSKHSYLKAFNGLKQLFEPHYLNEFSTKMFNVELMNIDDFIYRFDAYYKLGCVTISQLILECEAESIINFSNKEGWYQDLWHIMYMLDGEIDFSNISIITFNYDRSLDRYLVERLNAINSLTKDQIMDKKIMPEILHIYGTIAPAYNDLDGYFEYSGFNQLPITTQLQILKDAPNRLYTISSKIPIHHFERAKTILKESEIIIFLGFGFHENNLKAIGFDKLDTRKKIVQGTLYGLYEPIKDFVRKHGKNFHDEKIKQFITNHLNLN